MERNKNIDVLKGIAIILVVWGHVIQLMGVQPYPFDNNIWKAIYLFHMPLFFLISGFVSRNAIERNFKDLCISRFKTLFLPAFIWTVVLYILQVILGIAPVSKGGITSTINLTIFSLIKEYWFIWVLLYSIFMANIVYKIGRHKTSVMLTSVLLVWLLPETPIPLINNFKTMYFFFIMGYMVALHKSKFRLIRSKVVISLSIPVFIFCTLFSTHRTQMYVPQWVIDVWGDKTTISFIIQYYVFFIAGAFSGICLCYNLMKLIPQSGKLYAVLQDIGKYTFIIYMLQGLWFYSFCKRFVINIEYQTLGFVIGMVFTYLLYRLGKRIAMTRKTAFLAGK